MESKIALERAIQKFKKTEQRLFWIDQILCDKEENKIKKKTIDVQWVTFVKKTPK